MDQLDIETVLFAISEPGLDSSSEEVADIKIMFSSSPVIKKLRNLALIKTFVNLLVLVFLLAL